MKTTDIEKSVALEEERIIAPPPVQRVNKKLGYFRRTWLLYVMMIPALIILLMFKYYPMFGIQLAFKDWNPWEGMWGSDWAVNEAGKTDIFFHFKTVLSDPEFWGKYWNTIRVALLRIGFGFPVPILIALLLNEMKWKKYRNLLQTVSYLPHFVSWVIISNILITMFQADGSIQLLIERVVGHQVHFFSDSDSFLVMVTVSDIWKSCGWMSIIYFAALAAIDIELYEAAEIDGAGRYKKMRYITLPGIMPVITLRLVFAMSGLTNASFDQMYNMYNTAVIDKGETLEIYLYKRGIVSGLYDISQAMSLFDALLGFALTFATNSIVKKLGGEGVW